MSLENVVSNYETLAKYRTDELRVAFDTRVEVFLEILESYLSLNSIPLSAQSTALAKFLYFAYWLAGEDLAFASQVETCRKPFEGSFFRVDLLKGAAVLSDKDAIFIADGVRNNPLLRSITMAMVTEGTRTSRLLSALNRRSPVNLGAFTMLFQALKPSQDEVSLHAYLIEKSIAGEIKEIHTRCQLRDCENNASWMVLCPHGDGQEYLCQSHKAENDFSFETYRYIFSTSCRHHADRRDCTYVLVSL